MVRLSDSVTPETIFFIESVDQKEALETVAFKLAERGVVKEGALFLSKLLLREKKMTTAVGSQVAIPHAKMEEIDRFFCALVLLKRGIDWKAIDNLPVRFLFVIGGPLAQESDYLELLSEITRMIKEETFRKKILTAKSPKDIMKLLWGSN